MANHAMQKEFKLLAPQNILRQATVLMLLRMESKPEDGWDRELSESKCPAIPFHLHLFFSRLVII